ncbi:MAG: hypothetical protein RML94_15520 [Bacteroidia bacterium]|nr:hypothetical protein [Bacteroidia bacterium]
MSVKKIKGFDFTLFREEMKPRIGIKQDKSSKYCLREACGGCVSSA